MAVIKIQCIIWIALRAFDTSDELLHQSHIKNWAIYQHLCTPGSTILFINKFNGFRPLFDWKKYTYEQ